MKIEYPIEFYVERISHFLKGIRTRKNLTQIEISKSTKISISTISRLESKKVDSMTLDNLLRLSSLAEMRLSNFFLYLEKNFDNQGKDLAPWQKDAIGVLEKLKTRTRLLFIKKVLMESSPNKREMLLDSLVELSNLSEATLEKLVDLIRDLKKEKD
jgi:transcriptional regulator with XRE-family HTH domain